MKKCRNIALLLIMVFSLSTILTGCSSSNSSRDADAMICAVKAVEDQLKSPSTAEFESWSSIEATDLGEDRWRVSGYVDAQNSFGATLRMDWVVTLTLTENGFKDASVSMR